MIGVGKISAGGGQVSIDVTGVELVAGDLRAIGERVRGQLRGEMSALGDLLASAQRAGAPKKTGYLARRVKKKLWELPDEIKVVVYPRTGYSFVLERGFENKLESIKGHTRRVKRWDVKAKVLNEKTGKERRKTIAQGVTYVKPHDRVRTLKARPYLNPAYQSIEGNIQGALERAVDRSAQVR